jgi:hypothetical protein
MSDFTDYVEGSIVDWMVGGSDMPTAHSNVYVALHTGDPGETGDSNEVSTTSYSRASTSANGDWTRSGNTFENAVDISFPQAQENWGTISHFSLWDGSSGSDNAIAYSALNSSRSVETDDSPIFRAGSLTGSVN